jgi:serine/threonine protein kinase
MERFRVVKQIGRGAFGAALLVQRKPSIDDSPSSLETTTTKINEQYVIKKIDVSCLSRQESLEAQNEVKVLAQLAHIKHGNPFIIGYHSAFVEKGSLHILLNYAENGDLSQAITKTKNSNRQFRQPQILDWFVQISSALKFVHGKNILHRDLKTQNVFLDRNWTVKLGDFGIAKVLTSTTAKANTMVGTPYYLSPELCEDKPYDKKSDVWALGCILYELCTLRHAFEGRNMCALVLRIVKGKYPPIKVKRNNNGGYSLELKKLVDCLLSLKPSDRPFVHELLRYNFIKHHIKNMEMNGRWIAERKIVEAEARVAREEESKEDNAEDNRMMTAVDTDTVDGSNWSSPPSKNMPELGTRGRAIQAQRQKSEERRRRAGSGSSSGTNERRKDDSTTTINYTDDESSRLRERQNRLMESSMNGRNGRNGKKDSTKEQMKQVESAWKEHLSNYVGEFLIYICL